MEALFKAHLTELQMNAEISLEELSLPGLVLAAGSPIMKFEDDMPLPFAVNHHFRHWCPAKGPNHVLVIRAGKKPLLLAHQPEDYWHAVETIGNDTFWSSAFEIQVFSESSQIWRQVEANFRAYPVHGPLPFIAASIGLTEMPARFLAHLNWQRARKSDFEIECLLQAARLGAAGHQAARQAFLEGETEFGIHGRFLAATGLTEDELPYTPIIGLNANAAILHYHWKNKTVRDGHVLLIDAGAQANDYASDITRTYALSSAHPVFISLLRELEKAQQRLCSLVKPGLDNRDLHLESRREIAGILVDHGLIRDLSEEAVVAENLVHDFYPHGIGHPLGLHVHDVGGFQADRDGGELKKTAADGSLRSLRKFEARNYQTVEPGLYFIEMLLAKRKQTSFAKHYDWSLIESLKSCGGIRIEDNVLVTETGHRNVTREVLGDVEIVAQSATFPS